MKPFILLASALLLMLSGCENSKVNKKNKEERGNLFKTSKFGGCDFKTDCWDYNGAAFHSDHQTAQIKARCQSEGGQYVTNGCTDQNQLGTCQLNGGTETESVLHFYKQSGMTVDDAKMLCEAQSGAFKSLASGESEPAK